MVDFAETFARVSEFGGVIAGAEGGDGVVADGGLVSVAAEIGVREDGGGVGGGVARVEELAEADGGEAAFGEFGEDGGGIVEVLAEGVRVEVVDIIIIGELVEGFHGVAFGVETEVDDEGGDDAKSADDNEAQETAFRNEEGVGRLGEDAVGGGGALSARRACARRVIARGDFLIRGGLTRGAAAGGAGLR